MQLSKSLFSVALVLSSLSVQAGVIEFNGYSRQDGSAVVTGGGLDWLKWDQTLGLSINDVKADNRFAGWRIASNQEMANLYNAFQFGKSDWYANEMESQFSAVFTDATQQPNDMFISLFGDTHFSTCQSFDVTGLCYGMPFPFLISFAFFGSDDNKDNQYNLARVGSVYEDINGQWGAPVDRHYSAQLYSWTSGHCCAWGSSSMPNAGVALVRDAQIQPPNTVYSPSTISLLSVFGACILLRIRKKSINLS
jgi:hypothetical protein